MTAKVEFDFKEAEQMVAEFINDNAEIIAKKIAADARGKIHSVTGNLKRRVRAKESKFDDGGWIVQSTAPHSMLVEYGGVNVRRPLSKKVMKEDGSVKGKTGRFWGKEVAPMPAKPFLRPALDENIAEAKRQFGAK